MFLCDNLSHTYNELRTPVHGRLLPITRGDSQSEPDIQFSACTGSLMCSILAFIKHLLGEHRKEDVSTLLKADTFILPLHERWQVCFWHSQIYRMAARERPTFWAGPTYAWTVWLKRWKLLIAIKYVTILTFPGNSAYSGRTWHLIPLERGTPFRLKSAPDSGEVDTPATGFKM